MADSTAERPRRLSRKEKQARTREALLDAAERVFLRRGFDGASVEEITAEAGFTRGAFYSNFRSKGQLLVDLLHARVYDSYRRILEESPGDRELSPRERLRWGAERAREMQDHDDGRGLFRLWLECLTQAARDEGFRELAATFWSGNRTLLGGQLAEGFRRQGREPPVPPRDLATAMTALDIGLAVQHLVDPNAVPLNLYPRLYDLLFGGIVDPES